MSGTKKQRKHTPKTTISRDARYGPGGYVVLESEPFLPPAVLSPLTATALELRTPHQNGCEGVIQVLVETMDHPYALTPDLGDISDWHLLPKSPVPSHCAEKSDLLRRTTRNRGLGTGKFVAEPCQVFFGGSFGGLARLSHGNV